MDDTEEKDHHKRHRRKRAGSEANEREHSRSRSMTHAADLFDTIKHTLAKMVHNDDEDEEFIGPDIDEQIVQTLLHPFHHSQPQSRQTRTRSAGDIIMQQRESQLALVSMNSPSLPSSTGLSRQRSQSHDLFTKTTPTRVSVDDLKRQAMTPPPQKLHSLPEVKNEGEIAPPPLALVTNDDSGNVDDQLVQPKEQTGITASPTVYTVSLSQKLGVTTAGGDDSDDSETVTSSNDDLPDSYSPPLNRQQSAKTRLLQDWHSHEKHQGVSWFELFTDLTFVAIIIKMADNVKYLWIKGKKYDKTTILFEMFVTHAAFFTVWLEFTTVFTRFISSSWQVQFMYYLYMAGLMTMAVNVHEDKLLSTNFIGFTVGVSLCVGLLIFIHVHFWHIPRAYNYCFLQVLQKSLALVILIVAVFVPRNVGLVLLIIALGGLFVGTLMTFRVTTTNIPVNVHHFGERFGLLIMLYIGESELAVILPNLALDASHYILAHLSFASVYVLRVIYFELAAHISDELHVAHALRNRGHPGAVAFVAVHGVMSFALLCQAIGLKFMFTHLDKYGPYKAVKIDEGLFLTISVVMVQLSMVFSRYTHQGINPQWIYLMLRGVLLGVLFSLPWIAKTPILLVTGILAISCTFLFVDVFAIQLEIDETPLEDYGAERRRKSLRKNPTVAYEHEHQHGQGENAFIEMKRTVTESRRSARLSNLPGLAEFQHQHGTGAHEH